MPSLLVHIAIQSTILRRIDTPRSAILAGCIIPDVPWIFLRTFRLLELDYDLIDVWAYGIAQTSLAGTTFACLAASFFFKQSRKFAAIAFSGCVIHLLLDSLEHKWGNGVHLFAPLDWDYFQIGVFSVSSWITLVVSVPGLLIACTMFAKAKKEAKALKVSKCRLAGAGASLALYLAVPLAFIDNIVDSDVRYLKTLRNTEIRIGQTIELDRAQVIIQNGRMWIRSHTDELIEIAQPPEEMVPGNTSVKATFIRVDAIDILNFEPYKGFRELESTLGFFVLGLWLVSVLAFRLRGT